MSGFLLGGVVFTAGTALANSLCSNHKCKSDFYTLEAYATMPLLYPSYMLLEIWPSFLMKQYFRRELLALCNETRREREITAIHNTNMTILKKGTLKRAKVIKINLEGLLISSLIPSYSTFLSLYIKKTPEQITNNDQDQLLALTEQQLLYHNPFTYMNYCSPLIAMPTALLSVSSGLMLRSAGKNLQQGTFSNVIHGINRLTLPRYPFAIIILLMNAINFACA